MTLLKRINFGRRNMLILVYNTCSTPDFIDEKDFSFTNRFVILSNMPLTPGIYVDGLHSLSLGMSLTV